MRIYIEATEDGYCVFQGEDEEIIAGPFSSYGQAETALNELNPPGDDTFETNR